MYFPFFFFLYEKLIKKKIKKIDIIQYANKKSQF